MSEPFLAEIRMVGFNFAPRGWAFCDGQILPISQNQSLYSLLGTTYGGDGRTSFALPDLRGRTPIHVSSGHMLGQKTGEETHALSINEIPMHAHSMKAVSDTADSPQPTGAFLATAAAAVGSVYTNTSPDFSGNKTLNRGAAATAGGSQGHDNMQPFLVVNFCIALQGLFPSRN